MSDVRDALRALRAAPVVSAVAILSLALGIGANTAIFSILDGLLLRTLPVKEPQRLAVLEDGSWTNPIWEQIRDRVYGPQEGEGAARGVGVPADPIFDGAFAWSSPRFDLASGGESEYANGIWASGRFFEVLGVPAILGRTFTEADDRRGGGPDGPVAVISYAFWQRRFGGAADVIGRAVTLDRVSFTIIGVTGPGFFGPDVGRSYDVAIPIGTEPLLRPDRSALDQRSWWWLNIMARLKPGQGVDAATAALRGVQPQIREATLPERWRPQDLAEYLKEGLTLAPAATGRSSLRRRYEQPLLAIMVVVGLVLLIACANIANLLLARATSRRHEFGVRAALGASRLRLARQLFVESFLLAGAGAAAGLALAAWASRLLVHQLATGTSEVTLDLPLDWRLFAFTAAVTAATALLFGMAPAFRASRVQPSSAIKEQGRGVTGERRLSLGHAMVVAQVALSLVLVVAAGLFLRTFASLAHLDLGFDRDRVLVVSINAQRSGTPMAERTALFERARQAVAALPGVAHAGLSVITPVSGSAWNNRIEVPDGPSLSERERLSYFNAVSQDWFATFGTPFVAGRAFDDRDRTGGKPVVIVNETFARKFLPGQNALGHLVHEEGRPGEERPPMEIVGLVRDAVYRSLREPVPPTMYIPLAQMDVSGGFGASYVNLTVRAAAGAPAALTRSVLDAIVGIDRDLSLTVSLVADQVDASLTQERLLAMLAGFFGALALLLAGIGLYGVTSYAVSRRRAEIGIRMALGADRGGVVRLVLGRVAMLVGAGVLAGGGLSLWASRFAESLLFGLGPRDPATFVLAAAVLALVGAAAGWLPARRASRLDPAQVLREG